MKTSSSILSIASKAKEAAILLGATTAEKRNEALHYIADAIVQHEEEIMKANQEDVSLATQEGLSAPMLSRLKVTKEKCKHMVEGVKALIDLADPLSQVQYAKELSAGLNLYRVSRPMGVVGVIFESRPDALVQISTLCLKSGNAVLLKGGREAMKTNQVLADIITQATAACGIVDGWCGLLHSREDVAEMLSYDQYIDLIIPRGSNGFVKYIMQNSNIPVLGHADGVCHVYVDECCDLEMAVLVCVDSKAQNLSVCNATETLLVHAKIADQFLPLLAKAMKEKGITLRGDEKTCSIVPCDPATADDWSTEYLDAILSIAIVDDLSHAIAHINYYGSHHTDCIVSNNNESVATFFQQVDSADVFHNCSTRFADGFLFGLGAEVGIATGKLHARGPMGMEGLCTYQYRLYGQGQTLDALNQGAFTLTHRSLPLEEENR